MKLDLHLYGISVSATPAGVTLVINGTALRFSSAEFSALAHALGSIQEILARATPHAASIPASVPTVTIGVNGTIPKKRGRPPKNPQPVTFAVSTPGAVLPTATGALPKKRGRPPKNPLGVAAVPPVVIPGANVPKKRGRPPKNPLAYVAAPVSADGIALPKKRGRPPKNPLAYVAAPVSADGIAVPRKRGRPPKNPGAVIAKHDAESADGTKRGPGRPRTDGTAVGAPRLVEIVDAWMAENPGPKSVVELAAAAEALHWVEGGNAAEFLERHVPRAPQLFVRLPDGRFRRRADKTPVEAPKAAKVLRRRGHDEVAIVRVEAPGT